MILHQFVRQCGTQKSAAEKLGTNRQQIQRWLKRDVIVVSGKLYAPILRLDTKEQFSTTGE